MLLRDMQADNASNAAGSGVEELRAQFDSAGQGHVFGFWEELDEAGRERLLADAREVDLLELAHLNETLVRGHDGAGADLSELEPAPYIPLPGDDAAARERWDKAYAAGEEAVRAGRVAAFVVAGGQGTRLGFDGPKGTFPVTPVKEKPLFQVFAEKIRAASERYARPIPWFIMTSHANHEATGRFFAENAYFGLEPERVRLFRQGRMPAVDHEGRILLAAKDRIAMSPDGHGGSLRALVRSGAVAAMEEAGIDLLSYFQVDNPLVPVIDPAFIGFHLEAGSDASSIMIPKAYPKEKLGHFCRQRGRTVVIEYSDLPDELAEQREANGELFFRAGSIAIHLFDREFVRRCGSGSDTEFHLPFHRAEKKIPTIDAAGNPVEPDGPNGIKFEMFVFDALPFAQKPVIVEAAREDVFSPVKNAEGVDSPRSCREDQCRQFARWLRAAGEAVPTDDSGLPPFALEVSPLFAYEQAAFAERWKALPADRRPAPGDGFYLE
jgi:UDP-N-acetylglucosamine/UDP-N-acetylgalactosamine diphosphorylase